MLYTRFQQILQAKWLIQSEIIQSYIPIFISMLSGQKIDVSSFTREGGKPYAININTANTYDLTYADIMEDSVAVIPVNGVITSWYSMEIERYIKMANDNQNIIAILFITNTPGGMVTYTDILANCIKNSLKPTVDFIIGMEASAGIWAMSGAKYRISSSELDSIGSIGVMMQFMDLNKMLKTKFNIDIYELYASAATKKNKFYRMLTDENLTYEEKTKHIIDDLNITNNVFHRVIQENLGIDPTSEVFNGDIFYAPRAIELGLINEINTLDYAIQKAYDMGISAKIKYMYNQIKK